MAAYINLKKMNKPALLPKELKASSHVDKCSERIKDDYKTLLQEVYHSQQKVTITNFFDPLQTKNMTKKEWFALLVLYVTYLFFGAVVFFFLEQEEESNRRSNDYSLYEKLVVVLKQCSLDKNATLDLENYCGRPLSEDVDIDVITPRLWDFYNSVFFVFTVVSTVGYGNIYPTTAATRIIMIFYAIIGIPINGILLTSLAQFFSTVFIRAHKKYKRYESRSVLTIDVLKYLVPGILFFIFVPATAFYYFENWTYEESVYYAFVTLTTIGFGDMVAGQKPANEITGNWILAYKILLLCWIIFGLGYLIMILGFITRAMRSKKMANLEHKLVEALTHSKIWHGFSRDIGYLRRLINEIHLEKFKPVFLDEHQTRRQRSRSLPDLNAGSLTEDSENQSECTRNRSISLNTDLKRRFSRTCSENDLSRIDRRATFAYSGRIPAEELFRQVVDAMEGSSSTRITNSDLRELKGADGFPDDEILKSEDWNDTTKNSVTLSNYPYYYEDALFPFGSKRGRAFSECPPLMNGNTVNSVNNTEWTWSGTGSKKMFEIVNERHKRFSIKKNGKHGGKLISNFPPEEKCIHLSQKRVQQPYNSISGSEKSLFSYGDEMDLERRADKTMKNRKTSRQSWKSNLLEKNAPHSDRTYVTYTAGSGTRDLSSVTGNQKHSRPERSLPELHRGEDRFVSEREEPSLAEFINALTSLHRKIVTGTDINYQSNRSADISSPNIQSLINLFAPSETPLLRRKPSEKPQSQTNLKRLGRFLLRSYSVSPKPESNLDFIPSSLQSNKSFEVQTCYPKLQNNYRTITGNTSVAEEIAGSKNYSGLNVGKPAPLKRDDSWSAIRGRRGSTPALMIEMTRPCGVSSKTEVNFEPIYWDSQRFTPIRRRPSESCSAKPCLSDVEEITR